jgi:hypothetical protein
VSFASTRSFIGRRIVIAEAGAIWLASPAEAGERRIIIAGLIVIHVAGGDSTLGGCRINWSPLHLA